MLIIPKDGTQLDHDLWVFDNPVYKPGQILEQKHKKLQLEPIKIVDIQWQRTSYDNSMEKVYIYQVYNKETRMFSGEISLRNTINPDTGKWYDQPVWTGQYSAQSFDKIEISYVPVDRLTALIKYGERY